MKILLVNEKVEQPNVLPSVGLAILAALAKQHGHQVKVIDYQITPNAPSLLEYVLHLKPNIVGFRCVNENWPVVTRKITKVRPFVEGILVGGPFPTLHWRALREDPRILSIFVGESETTFLQFLQDFWLWCAKKVYHGRLEAPLHLPLPAFETFHQYKAIHEYPLQMSRGCPYGCSFCMTPQINSLRWRPRRLNQIYLETYLALEIFPNLQHITVIDDNPTHDLARFQTFLEWYQEVRSRLGAPPLSVLNIRADRVTPQIATLLAQCGVTHLILGLETVGARAMARLGKQVTPKIIRHAKQLLETAGIVVGCSFIIGLPGDDWGTVNQTIQFAKALGLQKSLWGHLLPFEGTAIRKQVTVLNDYAPTMVAPARGQIIECTGSETRELPEWWQIKGWLRANIQTNPQSLRAHSRQWLNLLSASIRYAEVGPFLRKSIQQGVEWWIQQKMNQNGGV